MLRSFSDGFHNLLQFDAYVCGMPFDDDVRLAHCGIIRCLWDDRWARGPNVEVPRQMVFFGIRLFLTAVMHSFCCLIGR